MSSSVAITDLTLTRLNAAHPCNIKDFEVYIGTSQDHLKKALRSVLKNDSKPETFSLPTRGKDGIRFPTQFVKIVPISFVQSAKVRLCLILTVLHVEPILSTSTLPYGILR